MAHFRSYLKRKICPQPPPTTKLKDFMWYHTIKIWCKLYSTRQLRTKFSIFKCKLVSSAKCYEEKKFSLLSYLPMCESLIRYILLEFLVFRYFCVNKCYISIVCDSFKDYLKQCKIKSRADTLSTLFNVPTVHIY